MANNNNPMVEGPTKDSQVPVEQAEAKSEEQPDVKNKKKSETRPEGEPEAKDEGASTGKGPKPVGPEKQTWDNPKPGEELKKEIDDQLARLKKLGENPSEHDPKVDELNKKQDIESRNEGPEHDKKSENNTQDDFDPSKHKSEGPSH